MRKLSNTFLNCLKTDPNFQALLKYVKSDNTLDIEIRENYFNIYYRGGNASKITEFSEDTYEFHFDKNYFTSNSILQAESIPLINLETDWKEYFPIIKQGMDFFFTKNPKEEREFQQLVVRENNYSSIANSTDYFILDIEYDDHRNARFDMVAIEWESAASSRKLLKEYMPRLAVIEMKYGDGALKGTAGLLKHIEDFNQFISHVDEVEAFKAEMITILQQKRELGLIPGLSKENNPNEVKAFQHDLDLIFLIANHDPASSILRTEIGKLSDNIKFATANFTGYGLYKQNVFARDQFINRFKEQI